MKSSPNIVLIDDHTLFLKGLCGIISNEFKNSQILCFESIKECQKNISNFGLINLILCDIELPGEDVFSFLKQIKEDLPDLPIIVITMHKKLSIIRKCKKLNIDGYLLKDDDDLLQQTIRDVLAGKTYYSPRIEKLYRSYFQQLSVLSPREEEVTRMIGQGLSNKEISDKIFVSVETVKTHKKNIKLKLGISELSDLVQYAHNNFLI